MDFKIGFKLDDIKTEEDIKKKAIELQEFLESVHHILEKLEEDKDVTYEEVKKLAEFTNLQTFLFNSLFDMTIGKIAEKMEKQFLNTKINEDEVTFH